MEDCTDPSTLILRIPNLVGLVAHLLRYHTSATLSARKAQQFVPLLDGRPSRTRLSKSQKRIKLQKGTQMSLHDYSKISTNS